MTKGVVLLAYNNGIDYIKLAKDAAKRIHYFLELPVTLITDTEITDNSFDNVIKLEDLSVNFKTFRDGVESKKLQWKNFNRSEVFNLSPYDYTLVLDVDYVIQSSFLKKCFTLNQDLLMFKHSYDIADANSNEFIYLNNFSIPFYWATVVFFKKTNKNNLFFSYVRYIKDNWEYFKELYQIVDNKFRNDFAFSIALHILNGFIPDETSYSIPGKLHYVTDKNSIIELQDKWCLFEIKDKDLLNDSSIVRTTDTDVHVMNKYSLLRCLA